MYPNNIYIKNFATIDKYENEHGVKKDGKEG